MAGLVGIVRLDGQAVDRGIIDRWKKGGGGISADRVRAGDCWAFAHARGPACFESRAPQPFELTGGRQLFVESRLDQIVGNSDSCEAVSEACERRGADACTELYGDFAYALWDPAERRLTLARDALGARALYYVFDGTRIAFATTIHLLLALPDTPRDLDELGIADMFVGATDAPERTIYRHIRRVLPGGTATFTPAGCRTARYWTLDAIAPVRFARDEDYVEAARDLFERAVACRLPAEGKVAAMLSGGFDSAGVVATAARLLGDRRLTAYTRVAGAPHPYLRFDEQGLAGKVAARHSNIDWVVIDDLHTAPRDTSPEWEAAASGVPTNGFARTWFEPIHDRVAASGAGTLLVGKLGNATLSWSGKGMPESQFKRGGVQRWLARRVFADRLPPELLAQDRRGKQVAEWYTLATMRREATAEEVERIGRSPLASRVLDVPRLKALVDSWPADADAARATEREHRFALHQGVTIGSFLRWHEGGNGGGDG